MSHKQCSCIVCLPIEKPGDDKLFKRPIELMEPPMESFVFTPEDYEASEAYEADLNNTYSREVCDHNVRLSDPCGRCQQDFYGRLSGVEFGSIEGDQSKVASNTFKTKDSGKRQEFSTGMVRDTNTGKPRYDLLWQPGIKRLAELMARGAVKYSARNWEKASTQEELDRFVESAARHFHQWLQNETDEDHMSATVFNLFGAEMVREKLRSGK